MSQTFTDLEGLRIAVEMERRGESFYRRAAKVSRNPEMISLLTALADEEVVHAREFQRLADLANADQEALSAYDEESAAYLNAVAADIIFPGGLMALRSSGFDDPRAVLTDAIASEKDSILFYTELADRARCARHRAVFLEIARQERGHLARLAGKLNALNGKNE